MSFCNVFFEGIFFAFGRVLGAQGAQRAPKIDPKGSQRASQRRHVGSAKTMVFIVREAYGEVSGRLREATFSRLRLQTLSGGVSGSIFSDFMRFWVPFGGPWEPFGSTLGCFLGCFF